MSVKIYAMWTSIIGMFATQMAKGFVISKKTKCNWQRVCCLLACYQNWHHIHIGI